MSADGIGQALATSGRSPVDHCDQVSTFIYALCDDDRTVRYVGKSIEPHRRLRGHVCDRAETPKAVWIAELRKQGKSPVLVLLDCVAANESSRAEKRWIARFRRRGLALLNQNLGGAGRAADADADPKFFQEVYEADGFSNREDWLAHWEKLDAEFDAWLDSEEAADMAEAAAEEASCRAWDEVDRILAKRRRKQRAA